MAPRQTTTSPWDPASWAPPLQKAAIYVAIGVTFVATFAPSPWWRVTEIGIPVIGSLIWRFDRIRWRDIGLLTVPLGAALLLLDLQPNFALLLAGHVFAVLTLAAMMFSERFRSRWLRFVASLS